MRRDYESDLLLGNMGQLIAKQYLISKNGVYGLEDVSADPSYRNKGVDFIWRVSKWDEDDIIVKGEVKFDLKMHSTGNFFIETQANIYKGRKGWINSSEADRLLYIDNWNYILYDLDMRNVREFVENNKGKFLKGTASTGNLEGKVYYYTKGVLVPVDVLLSSTENHEVSDVKNIVDNLGMIR